MMEPNDRLIHRFLDGELTEGEIETLETQLRSGSDFRRAFYECVMLEEALRGEFRRLEVGSKRRGAGSGERDLRRHWRLSLAAAAAVIALVLAIGYFLGAGDYRGEIVASADCDYRSAGSAGGERLEPGERLEIARGVLEIELTPSARVVVEGPAELVVRNRSGDVELRRGRAFFDLGPGSRGLEVTTPSGRLVDIGTRFGVSVMGGREEVQVMEGIVEAWRGDELLGRVHAGEAAAFHGERYVGIDYRPAEVLTALPAEVALMRDGFDGEDETRMATRSAPVGGPWFELEEFGSHRIPPEELASRGASVVRAGAYDTSGGFRIVWTPVEGLPEGRTVYLLRLRTRPTLSESQPGNRLASEGAERVALTRLRTPVLGLGGRGSEDGHFWFIESGEEQAVENSSHVPVSSEQELLLRYDSRTGLAEMFRGTGSEIQLVSRRQVAAGLSFDGVVVMNHERWGDVALDHLEVDAVVYPDAEPAPPGE